MTTKSSDTDFSYRLTESLLSQTPNSTLSSSPLPPQHQHQHQHQQTTPRFVAPLPPNAMVFQQRDSDSSFNQYIGNHFKEDAPVFLDRLQVATPAPSNKQQEQQQQQQQESTFWAYLSKDLDGRPSDLSNKQRSVEEGNNKSTWYEYDSVFTDEQTSLITTTSRFFSMGAFFFLLGFIFPPFWWIGSFYPTRVEDSYKRRFDGDTKMALRWRLLNRFFSLGFSTLLVIVIIVLAIVYSKT